MSSSSSSALDPAAPPPRRLSLRVGEAGRYLAQGLRLMVGVPDYGSYVSHHEATHPGLPAMSYEEFFRERQEARYGGKGRIGRCC